MRYGSGQIQINTGSGSNENTFHPVVYLAANHLWTSKDLLAAAEVPRPT